MIQPKLRGGGQLALDTLEVYCAAYERWVLAQKWLDEHGDVLEIVSDKGVVLKAQPAPKLDVAARAEKAMAEAMKVLRVRLT
jgi:phage terminase small subunit